MKEIFYLGNSNKKICRESLCCVKYADKYNSMKKKMPWFKRMMLYR